MGIKAKFLALQTGIIIIFAVLLMEIYSDNQENMTFMHEDVESIIADSLDNKT